MKGQAGSQRITGLPCCLGVDPAGSIPFAPTPAGQKPCFTKRNKGTIQEAVGDGAPWGAVTAIRQKFASAGRGPLPLNP
jgi:hypothetical protein